MKKWITWTKRILLGILLLIILLILSLQTPSVKRFIRAKLENYLIAKTGTDIRISALNYRVPKWVELDGVFIKDKTGDTLLYGNKLRVDINMFKLLSGQYVINRIELGQVTMKIGRKENDSLFNYQFLIDAFRSKTPADPKKKSSFSVSLDEVVFTGCRFSWQDRYGGMLLETRIGSFDTKIDSLDINTNRIFVNSFNMADTRFDLQLLKTKTIIVPVTAKDTIKSTVLPVVICKKLSITGSEFSFTGQEMGIHTSNTIGELDLANLSTSAQQVSLDKISLLNSSLSLDRRMVPKKAGKESDTDTAGNALVLAIQQAQFTNNNISYNDLSVKKKQKGFDADHISIRSFSGSVTGIHNTSQNTRAVIASLSLKEQSGFVLDSMHGNISMYDTLITAKDILVKTNASRIAGNAKLYPQSFDARYKGNAQNDFSFHNNIIGRKDIELLAPVITDKYRKQLQGITALYITADGSGNARRMILKTVSAHSDKNDLNLTMNGSLANILSKDALQYDISIPKAVVSKSFLDPFLNTNGKQTVNLPPVMALSGKVKGDMKQLNNDLVLTSAYGTAAVKGQLRNFTKPDKLGYNMRLLAKELETGKWINKDSLLGKVNGTILINGSGIDYKTATATFSIDLNSFRLQQHVYTGIGFKGKSDAGVYAVKGGITDSLLRLTMDMNGALNQAYPTATGKINISNADLYTLGLYSEPLRFRTRIEVQAKDLTPQTLNAYLRMDSTIVYEDKKTFRADSLLVKGIIDSGKTLLTLRSPFADATIKGDYRYTELPGVLQGMIAKYTKTGKTRTPVSEVAVLDLAVDLKSDPIYALLLPGLFFDKNIHANGRIDTKQKDSSLSFYLTAPMIAYNSNRLSRLDTRISGINDSLKYTIHLDTVHASSLLLYSTSVSGGIGQGRYTVAFTTNDPKKKEKYAFGVVADTEGDAYHIHLADKLKLNYVDWNVDAKNMISYSPQGINIKEFTISKGSQSISVNSAGSVPNAPMDIKIDRFALSNITGLLNRDSLEIGGNLTAQVKVEGLDKKVPLFNGTVKVDSLSYQKESVGNIAINAKSEGAEGVSFDGGLTGNGNNVTLKGDYNQDKINAQVNLAPVEFATIEPFTQHALTRSAGKITGNINITGPVSAPEWNGTVRFDSAFTQLKSYGTVLKMSGQQVDFKYPVVTLNQFTIKDSLDHPLVINGTLKQENGELNTDLTIKTKDFIALDNNEIVNNEVYGKAIVDVNVVVKGTATAPEVTGKIGLEDKSQVTYVNQQSVTSTKDRDKVMEFVNMDTIHNLVFKPSEVVSRKTKAGAGMLNYNLDIDIDKNAKFTIIVDPLTRDELMVQGAGQLTASVNPNGDISLTGAYNLTKGSYQLNYQFLKRKFDLQEGSTITLSGDPMNAEANITAVYSIETSPYDLIANEIADNTNSAEYKQKVPFQVVLMIKGKISEPQITFDVVMQDKREGVNYDMATTIDNKLSQMRADPSTMNKQVFALLVMGRFIGEQSKDFFASSTGNGIQADAVVKESVGRFLTDAVSQLAADLIKGVDVDVNLKTVDNYTDQTERTDLNLALSKRFLNDRLNITVGKSFTVDGEDPLAKGQDNANVSFLPDITTTYKLSKDGRYMLKAYQKSEYEEILDGYFIETGVAFTLSMDYNRFKELFQKNKDKKAKKGTTEVKK